MPEAKSSHFIIRSAVSVLLLTGSSGCLIQESSSGDQSVFASPPAHSCADEELTGTEGDSPAKLGAHVVNWRMTEHMYDPSGKIICTPKAIREKVKRVFDLYASISDLNVTFHYLGADPNTYPEGCIGRPYDGALNVLLDCFTGSPPQAGMDNVWGLAHTDRNPTAVDALTYPGGEAIFPPGSFDYETLIHEIGHTLGQFHIPALGANMSYYGSVFTGSGGVGEYYQFTEQERADLIRRVPAATAKVYFLSGQVKTDLSTTVNTDSAVGRLGGIVDVYAVNTVNGRTYIGLGDTSGNFSINILKAGDYRIVAIPDGYPNAIDQSQYSASWYIDSTTVTNNPTGGTVLTVNDTTPSHTGLVIQMGNAGVSPSNFALNPKRVHPDPSTFTPAGSATPLTFAPMMMSPGDSGTFEFDIRCDAWQSSSFAGTAHCDSVSSVSGYGTAPDYSFSNLTLVGSIPGTLNSYKVKVTANAGAEPGFRVMLASPAAGTTQVAVMGVHILSGATKPPMFTTSLSDQLLGLFDFSALNALYWY